MVYGCASKTSSLKINENIKPAILTLELSEGKVLYAKNCAECHKLYEPKSYSAEEWKSILQEMKENTELDEDQVMKVYNYLTMN